MREIKDEKLLKEYLQAYHIEEIFDTPNLPFQLFEYEKGEMMNVCHPPVDYLKFIVKGEWNLFYDSSMGRRYVVGHADTFFILGDMELCCDKYVNNWQQVSSTVHSVELPLAYLKDTLLNDNRFLRFLLKNISEKMLFINPIRDGAITLEEKVMYYLRYEHPKHYIENVNKVAEELHYSRRQMHRVLNKLIEEDVVKKDGKRYVLNEPV